MSIPATLPSMDPRKHSSFVALLITTILLLGCTSPAPSFHPLAAPTGDEEAGGFSTRRLARLDKTLRRYVEDGKIPGYQLMVSRRGQVVHESLYGARDVEADLAVEEDTIFRIYSMSKVITGVATLAAFEQGLFLLNEPVSKYLPALGEMEVMLWNEDGSTRTVPAEREITILDLLRHSSGLSYHFIAPPPLGDLYVSQSITPGLRPLESNTALGSAGRDQEATLKDMVDRLGSIPLIAQPGSGWHYGINMDVLGRLIEVTSGQSFPEFLKENVFRPVGMPDTGFYVPAEKVDRFAACYGPDADGGMTRLDSPTTSAYLGMPAMPGGGGGLVSTTSDYMRFAQMLLNGGTIDGRRVLGRRTVDLMMSNHLAESDFGSKPLQSISGTTYGNDGLGVGFGLTGSVVTEPALTGLPLSKGTFGWGGAASTFFWVDPVEEIAVVFMTQLIPSNTYAIRADLMRGINSALTDESRPNTLN